MITVCVTYEQCIYNILVVSELRRSSLHVQDLLATPASDQHELCLRTGLTAVSYCQDSRSTHPIDVRSLSSVDGQRTVFAVLDKLLLLPGSLDD